MNQNIKVSSEIREIANTLDRLCRPPDI